nr:excisionase family DNA-binding protein [Actinopolymorpha pittospori]
MENDLADGPPIPRDELLLTIEEAAKVLKIGRTKMCALLGSGAVESVYIGRLRRIPFTCIQQYVASLLDDARKSDRAA